jgi:predicted nucleic acid-binding protein
MLFFVDANVLLYTRDRASIEKRRLASAWIRELARRDLLVLNLQVLNEVCHAALRKLGHIAHDEVRAWAEELAHFGSSPLDPDIVEAAWDIRRDYRLSWFDCLVVASAERLGCTHLLTEDMGSPRQVGAIFLVHPFGTSPRDVLQAS